MLWLRRWVTDDDQSGGLMTTGWVIRVTSARPCARSPVIQIYHVAIPDAAAAIRVVRRACGADTDAVVETIAALPSGTDLHDGEVLVR
jgi:hypothetical protein